MSLFLNKENFLVQVRYSDLVSDRGNVAKYFLGYGGEIYFTGDDIGSPESGIIGGIKSYVNKTKLPLRIHAPLAEIDYSDSDSALNTLKPLFEKTIEICRVLNIRHIVTHAELKTSTPLKTAEPVWRSLCDTAKPYGICVNIENHEEETPEKLIEIVRGVGSPLFGLCVDAGHFNVFGGQAFVRSWLDRYPPGSIKEAHLADNEGDGDTHLPLGEGNIDFDEFFSLMEKRTDSCVYVLEPRNLEEAEKSIDFLKRKGLIVS